MSISSKATGLRPGVCTSATRPTSPYTGMIIFQTDTGTMHNWDGTTWQYLAPTQQRNLLYNGAMEIQEYYYTGTGTSVNGFTTSNYYTCDRWRTDVSSLGTWSQSAEDLTGVTPTQHGFWRSMTTTCTVASASPSASGYCVIEQRLELEDLLGLRKGTANAQQLTLSFWVKSTTTGTYIVELFDQYNTRQVSKPYSISAANTWEYKTLTFPADTTGELARGTEGAANAWLSVRFWLAAGSNFTSGTLNSSAWASSVDANRAVGQTNLAASTNNNFVMTGVQLNLGSVAAPFQFVSPADELERCQRFFQRFGARYWRSLGGNYVYSILPSTGRATSATAASFDVPLRTAMRVRPHTVYTTGNTTHYSFNSAAQLATLPALTTNGTTFDKLQLTATISGGLTTGAITGLGSWTNQSVYIGVSAEIQ
jgi:hypothetical protein